jgi:hypothetical protein
MTTGAGHPFHLHVGLGRLGMGLALEYVRPEKPLIILQRRNSSEKRWLASLHSGQTLTLRNSNSLNRYVRVLIAGKNSTAIEKQIAVGGSYLVLYDHLGDLNWVAKYCASMTTSIGDKGWRDDLGLWIKRCAEDAKLLVFPFENDAELTVSKELTRLVTPDRICAEELHYRDGVVRIKVEKFAEIFINAAKDECVPMFSMDRKEIEAVQPFALYEYFHLRKRVLVNGLHYYLATIAYDRLRAKDVPFSDWHAQSLPILIEYVLSDAGRGQHPVDVLIGAQAMRLVLEAIRLNPPEREQVFLGRSKEQLYLSLLEDGTRNLARFKDVADPLERVLKLDDFDKFMKKNAIFVSGLLQFNRENEEEVDRFPARLKPWRADVNHVLEGLKDSEIAIWGNYFKARDAKKAELLNNAQSKGRARPDGDVISYQPNTR